MLYAPHPQTYAAVPAPSILSGYPHNFYDPYNQYYFPDIVQFPPAAQPVACTPSIESSCSDTKLPPINTLPHLSSLADWGSWYNVVMMLADHLGLTGHLCPIPPPGVLSDPTCEVVIPPPFHEFSMLAE
ncbi:hypothetical protein H2248_004897 [Termitomyces sp. 'cryptogamus']|nr:hypothetical protein H2248_004897 [Termitomyces sp. 'cryptogamus']